MTACSGTGTTSGSLVSKRLIKGVQHTESGEVAIFGLNSSETAIYNNMNLKLARSSDENYIASSVVVGDNSMSLSDNRTFKASGPGDCRNVACGS